MTEKGKRPKSKKAATMERKGPSVAPEEGADFQGKLAAILSKAVDDLGGKAGIVAFWNESEMRFVERASYGWDADGVNKLRSLLRQTMPNLVASRMSLKLAATGSQSPDDGTDKRQYPIVTLPLQITGRMGVVHLMGPFWAESLVGSDHRVLSAFADQVAISVQNALLAS